ncbi:MAG: hypothetical protein M5U25_09415 [Planctomycetota bacterium]|jgi:uncharacterized repeat protein (TIGR04138 family)|nr:hypothetical protein [Planctomycetota bacterium]
MDEDQEQPGPIDVEGLLLQVRRKDPRYRAAAYHFILFQGIEYTLRQHLGVPQGQFRHMSGREICRGLRELALSEFGPLARDVWAWWGVHTTRDWGEIVFNLIEVGLLHAQDDDCVEDFDNVYDVDEALTPARVK